MSLLEVVDDVGTRWPWLAGRTLVLASATVASDGEYVFWRLPDERVLAVAREALLAALAELAPEQVRVATVKHGGGKVEGLALREPERVVGFALGEELVGVRLPSGLVRRE